MQRPKRAAVKLACEACRKKRIKCDAQVPECGPCAKRGEACRYDSYNDETTTLSLKRRVTFLQRENLRNRDLIGVLRSRTEPEAIETLLRLRVADDALQVLDAVREAEILLPTPSFISSNVNNTELLRLEHEAGENSTIKVPARPWTSVAGDGIVSELVSEYFAWDNSYFFPSIDQAEFTTQMRECSPESASWCTPLLVNSICAHRSQTMGRAKIYSSIARQSLVDRFLDEAGTWIESELGRTSVPTAQALMLRYFTLTCMGRDRIGRVCRQHAVDMVRRLDLETRFNSNTGNSDQSVAEKKRISKALWGLFLVESRFAYFYLQPSQIPPPTIPHFFNEKNGDEPDSSGNVDILGRPFEDSTCHVALTTGTVELMCFLTELFYSIMMHNATHKSDRGSRSDVAGLSGFYSRLRQFDESLADQFRPTHNFTLSTCYLKMHINEVAFAIIQSQGHKVTLRQVASQAGVSIKDLCLWHCRSDVEISQLFLAEWPFEACLWRHQYLSLQPLVLLCDDPEARQLFTKASSMLRNGLSNFRICGHLLQATLAFAQAIGVAVPQESLPQFEGWREHIETKNLPLSFALPLQDDVNDLLRDSLTREDGGDISEQDLGTLIEQWGFVES